MRRVIALLVFLVAVPAARADVAPPNQCGKEGDACDTAGNDYKQPGVCSKQSCSRSRPNPDGKVETYSYDCLLCVPKTEKAPATTPAKKKAGCSVGGGADASGLAIVLGALLLARRRRR